MLPTVSSVCLHYGEEPVLSGENGICNVFFSKCNLQCIYCQNYQISRCNETHGQEMTTLQLAEKIIPFLQQGIDMLGFVSPTHFVGQMVDTLDILHHKGYFPTVVYNSNGYDSVETLKQIADYVDVYLPDFKYMDSSLAQNLSKAADYPEKAKLAIMEMYRQKGAKLEIDEYDLCRKGLIVRHLVLPENVQNSCNVLRAIASIDNQIFISVMSQYDAPFQIPQFPFLNRPLKQEEYDIVTDCIDDLGFENGWVQEMESKNCYIPDFNKENPFE
ncbi:MAG: 4Fe-4S cluster-binding domain-containing protein, partial [Bacteroidales bacterium]|nr:4Fe-4S cluster-binding domain-containing protein [Bacteroidales bacterium]